MKPEISYSHVLSELSVNRKDPCEIIRELISNAYDASASNIWIFPILQHSGLIFIDDGTGVSTTDEVNGIIPWRAFFSIGRSTKTPGQVIGYKCQGTKLCFASRTFHLLSKTAKDSQWNYLKIDNPKLNLSPNTEITPQKTDTPWQMLSEAFNPHDERTSAIIRLLDESFFSTHLNKGTIIAVRDLDIDSFTEFFDTTRKYSYLKDYIAFSTRHGDMRILDPALTGFKQEHSRLLAGTKGFVAGRVLHLWTGSKLESLKAGYPYIPKPEDQSIKKPSDVARLRDGRFFSRHASVIKYEDRDYALTLAVDGNRRALDHYESLDRRGPSSKRSGIRLTDQRGTVVCSQGVKVCPVNWIFEETDLQDYSVLSSDDAQSHFIFMINGNFDLVTNRNALSDASLKLLRSKGFLGKIRDFLAQAEKDNTFEQLLQRLRRETETFRIEKYMEQYNEVKESLSTRERFKVECSGPLSGQWLLSPVAGEEHWVGTLYSILSHYVSSDSTHASLWLRPRTFSGRGIDSHACQLDERSLDPDKHVGLEYKGIFSAADEYNHPLIVTGDIVAWQLDQIEEGSVIQDSFDYYGTVRKDSTMKDVGFVIDDIQSRSGTPYGGRVRVLNLKELIKRTFRATFSAPPPRLVAKGKSK